MRSLLIAAALLVLNIQSHEVVAQTTKAAPAAHLTTADTDIGTLLDTPAAHAIVDKYIPGLLSDPQIDQARGMTLKQAQSYVPDRVTDKALADIDAEFAKLPAKK